MISLYHASKALCYTHHIVFASALGGLSHLFLNPDIALAALHYNRRHCMSLSLLYYTREWDPSYDEVSNCSLAIRDCNSASCQAVRVCCCHGKLITFTQQWFESHASHWMALFQLEPDLVAFAEECMIKETCTNISDRSASVNLDCYDQRVACISGS